MTSSMRHHHLHDDLQHNQYIDMKTPQPRYLCPYGCNKLIATRTIDYHKNNGCGRRLTDNMTSHPELKKRFYCCGACYAEFVTRCEFHTHLRCEHDVHPEIHQMDFPDRATFDRFIRWVESEGGAHFRHKSGSKRRGRGKGIFMACNRSGFVSSEKSAPPPDRTGPFRLGFTCTAYIHATEHNDGHVTAEVCSDHYGHDARMRLPNAIKYLIAQKQMEGATNPEVIGFLRHHFMNLSAENIYAQRVCFVDSDELKGIQVSCTKKWMREGIPKDIEIWEEELLERAGITWPPPTGNSPQYPRVPKPTTMDLAVQNRWPRPRVFQAKTRGSDGVMVPFEMVNNDQEVAEVPNDDYAQEDMDDTRYIEMDMTEFEEEGYPHEEIVVGEEEEVEEVVRPEYQTHQRMLKTEPMDQILDEREIEVEVGNEVVVTSDDSQAHQQIMNDKIVEECVEEHVVIDSPTNEIVIVDGDVDDEMEHHHHHHHMRHMRHNSEQPGSSNRGSVGEPRFIEAHKADKVEQIMEEIEAFKHTVLKRADQLSQGNLKSLLIRFQTLHRSVLEKDHPNGSTSITVFPSRNKLMYRPGKGLEKSEQEYLNSRAGDVILQPIEDSMSDDEEMMAAAAEIVPFNACIWS